MSKTRRITSAFYIRSFFPFSALCSFYSVATSLSEPTYCNEWQMDVTCNPQQNSTLLQGFTPRTNLWCRMSSREVWYSSVGIEPLYNWKVCSKLAAKFAVTSEVFHNCLPEGQYFCKGTHNFLISGQTSMTFEQGTFWTSEILVHNKPCIYGWPPSGFKGECSY